MENWFDLISSTSAPLQKKIVCFFVRTNMLVQIEFICLPLSRVYVSIAHSRRCRQKKLSVIEDLQLPTLVPLDTGEVSTAPLPHNDELI